MDGFIGQMIMFAGNFAPRTWAFCDGQLLPIASNTALFSIIGTIYGGDGRSTMALPDMRGRFAVQQGTGPGLPGVQLGQRSGVERVTFTQNSMPNHSHAATAMMHAENKAGTTGDPTGNLLARTGTDAIYAAEDPRVNKVMHPDSVQLTVANAGGSIPVETMNPYLTVNYIICLQGIYPSRS